ncbi:MAG TPA: anhydro-N-acetylmuramic acid kinase, partial [Rhodospirillales bacterium]|nr:anhydro-N-acetylmuramic acid kinase [Rhodospirillales bacterium]
SLSGLGAADGAAPLAELTIAAIVRGQIYFRVPARRWLVCGGGRNNGFLMQHLAKALAVPVDAVEAVGWNGDMLEAQAFAYLAVRSLSGLPLSLPSTTGVPEPMPGGVTFDP